MQGGNGWSDRAAATNPQSKGAVVELTAEELADLRGQVQAISNSQAVVEFDLDGTVLTANNNFLDAMGYRLAEIQGQHHRIFVEPTTAASHEYHQCWSDLRAGKFQVGGFGVVANEVKELAKETARATESIGQRIDAIQNDTQAAVKAIRSIASTIQALGGSAKGTSEGALKVQKSVGSLAMFATELQGLTSRFLV